MLSETRTTSDTNDFELELNNYSLIRCDSDSRHTGGVLIYVRKDIEFFSHNLFILDKNYWRKVIKATYGSIKWLIRCLYHSPSDAIFLENFEETHEEFLCKNIKSVLVEDFNLDFMSNKFYVRKIKNIYK